MVEISAAVKEIGKQTSLTYKVIFNYTFREFAIAIESNT